MCAGGMAKGESWQVKYMYMYHSCAFLTRPVRIRPCTHFKQQCAANAFAWLLMYPLVCRLTVIAHVGCESIRDTCELVCTHKSMITASVSLTLCLSGPAC